MANINAGILGLGFIGKVHVEALMRLPGVRIAGICDENRDLARAIAVEYGCTAYRHYTEMLEDSNIDAIHNCTPNHLHFEINRFAIEKGKHVLSEKPLAMDSAESAQLLELSRNNPPLACGVCFQYRMYPLMQEYKHKFAAGELGKPRLVHGRYLQDWLMYDTDYNWRLSKQFAGKTRAIADIGSHWCDLAQNLTSSRITAVMADLVNIIPVRYKPKQEILTFSNTSGPVEREAVEIDTEDYGAVMVRFDNGARGLFYVSQVSGGHKCDLEIEVNTDTCSVAWRQEDSERIWIGRRDEANQSAIRSQLKYAGQYTALPAGHPEGFNDAFKNNMLAFYNYIKGGCKGPQDFATFEDGHNIMRLVDAIVESSDTKSWVHI